MKNKALSPFVFFVLLTACQSDYRSSGESALLNTDPSKFATTTIYFVETFSEAQANDCSESAKSNMLDRLDQVIARVCKKVFDSCLMEGTCRISIDKKWQMFNVDAKIQGVYRFRNITSSECLYGHGKSSDRQVSYKRMCLDPFYSIAADLKIYNLGDVVYLPLVRGTVLPNGEVHDGYFIIRDSGGGIEGVGRFDFFTGFFTNQTTQNPFKNLKLNGLQTFPEYYFVSGPESDRVRKLRGFPLLP